MPPFCPVFPSSFFFLLLPSSSFFFSFLFFFFFFFSLSFLILWRWPLDHLAAELTAAGVDAAQLVAEDPQLVLDERSRLEQRLVLADVQAGRVALAVERLQWLTDRHATLSVKVFNKVLTGLSQAGMTDQVLALVLRMDTIRFLPETDSASIVTYNILLHALMTANRVELGRAWFERLLNDPKYPRPQMVTLNTLLHGYLRRRPDAAQVYDILQLLRRVFETEGIVPSAPILVRLVKLVEQHKMMERLVDLAGYMRMMNPAAAKAFVEPIKEAVLAEHREELAHRLATVSHPRFDSPASAQRFLQQHLAQSTLPMPVEFVEALEAIGLNSSDEHFSAAVEALLATLPRDLRRTDGIASVVKHVLGQLLAAGRFDEAAQLLRTATAAEHLPSMYADAATSLLIKKLKAPPDHVQAWLNALLQHGITTSRPLRRGLRHLTHALGPDATAEWVRTQSLDPDLLLLKHKSLSPPQ